MFAGSEISLKARGAGVGGEDACRRIEWCILFGSWVDPALRQSFNPL